VDFCLSSAAALRRRRNNPRVRTTRARARARVPRIDAQKRNGEISHLNFAAPSDDSTVRKCRSEVGRAWYFKLPTKSPRLPLAQLPVEFLPLADLFPRPLFHTRVEHEDIKRCRRFLFLFALSLCLSLARSLARSLSLCLSLSWRILA